MRIKIELVGNKEIVLPLGFNESLQWLIYSLIKDDWLHNVGFLSKKRSFRLFVFSEIIEKAKFDKEKRVFIFPNVISFYVASCVDWILEKLAVSSINLDTLNMNNNELSISSISVLPREKIQSNTTTIKTLSPIEVHSTLEKDDKKSTYYYSPFDGKFSELINENLKKKWEAFYKEPCPYDIDIKPAGKNRKRPVRFGVRNRYIMINGYDGFFTVKAEPTFLKFALDVGLGSRNAQGFGMVEVVREKKREQKRSVKGAYSE